MELVEEPVIVKLGALAMLSPPTLDVNPVPLEKLPRLRAPPLTFLSPRVIGNVLGGREDLSVVLPFGHRAINGSGGRLIFTVVMNGDAGMAKDLEAQQPAANTEVHDRRTPTLHRAVKTPDLEEPLPVNHKAGSGATKSLIWMPRQRTSSALSGKTGSIPVPSDIEELFGSIRSLLAFSNLEDSR
jgi:hypothetical protein